jgi:hypothetical protein
LAVGSGPLSITIQSVSAPSGGAFFALLR